MAINMLGVLFIFSLITISTAPLASLALRRSELMAPVARRRAAPPCLVATFQPSIHRCPPAPTATHPKSSETHVRCLPNRFVREKDHRSAHAGKRGNARCFLLCQRAFLAGFWEVVVGEGARRKKIDRKLGFQFWAKHVLAGFAPGVVAFGSKNHTLIHNTFVPECIFLFGAKTCFALTMR